MDAPRLRTLLLRGSVVAVANWPVVVAQGIAESVVKALAGIPLAGAAVLLLLLSVPNAGPVLPPVLDGAAAALSALATVPAALAGVVVSAIVAAVGAIVFGAAIKAGTVTVLAAGEARARPMASGPLRIADLTAAHAWSRARFMGGCARFGPRFVRLGLALAVIEGAIALAYATAVVQAYRGFVSVADSWWIAPAVVAVSMIALAVSIGAELVYRLAQLVLVIEDASGVDAVRGALAFVRRDALVVARICVAALILSTLAFVITLIAAAAFGFVSFVPVAGVAVLPLQAAVWVVRGLMLPFIELAALAAYAAAYRRQATPAARPDRAGGWPAQASVPGPQDQMSRPEPAAPPIRAAAAEPGRWFPASR
jgi:hypothetical protein